MAFVNILVQISIKLSLLVVTLGPVVERSMDLWTQSATLESSCSEAFLLLLPLTKP